MALVPTAAQLKYMNLHVKDTKVRSILVANTVCAAISCLAVILRIISRRLTRIKLAADDYLIIFGLV